MRSELRCVPLSIQSLKLACSNCSLRKLCLPSEFDARELEELDRIVLRRWLVSRGSYLYRAGDELHALYVIRAGWVKNSVLLKDGREQVSGFHMMGDLMGLEAINANRHMCAAIALEDSEVCEIPLAVLDRLLHDIPSLQRHFNRVMSREISHDYGVMLLLGSMRAEERLAAFLLNLSQRFAVRGFSATEFHLRMTREDIGSYLGLKPETVSRLFSRFAEQGLVDVSNRRVRIIEKEAVAGLIGPRRSAQSIRRTKSMSHL